MTWIYKYGKNKEEKHYSFGILYYLWIIFLKFFAPFFPLQKNVGIAKQVDPEDAGGGGETEEEGEGGDEKKEKKGSSKSGKVKKVTSGIFRNFYLRFFIFFGIFLVLLIFMLKPLISLVDQFSNALLGYAAPGTLGIYDLAKWGLIAITATTVAYICAKMDPIAGVIVFSVIIIILFIVPPIFAAGILNPGGKIGDYFSSITCAFETDYTACINRGKNQTIQVPVVSKEKGLYGLVKITFGNEITNYKLPSLILNSDTNIYEKYSFSLSIKSLYPDGRVKVTIEGAIINKTCNETTGIGCAELSSSCKDSPCELGDLPLEFWMETNGPFNITGEKRLVINLSYEWFGWGRTDFVLAKTEEDVLNMDFPRPSTSIGPLDIIAFFIPKYHLTEPKLYQQNKTRMYIVLQNKDVSEGSIFLENISIDRFFDIGSFAWEKCSWIGPEITGENESINAYNKRPWDMGRELWIMCDYDLSKITGVESNVFLPYFAYVNYSFNETISNKLTSSTLVLT